MSSDLMNPSPRPSPNMNRRANGTVVGFGDTAMAGFEKVEREGEREGGREGLSG